MSKKVTEQDFIEAAKLLGVDVSTIKAVHSVESRGNGFLPSGQPVILFEGHKFWEQLRLRKINPNDYLKPNDKGVVVNADILYPTWTKKYYLGGEAEHNRLERAVKINRDAALASASYGLFQVMGFNFAASGFKTLQDFINAMFSSEFEQLKAFVNFCLNTKSNGKTLAQWLREKNWAKFAYGYNGSGYAANKYDVKLENAYNKFSK